MKKIFLFMLAAFTISSCVKDVDPTSYEQTKEQVLTDNFNTTFGVTEAQYANHRWGMNTVPLVVTSTSASRAMRVANVNGNEWGTSNGLGYLDYPTPAPITDDELDAVLAVFSKKGKEKYTTDVDFRNFFVQQVYCGDSVYTAKNGEKVTGSSKMQEMFCVTKYKSDNWPLGFEELTNYEWDYINNTNNGGASWMGSYNGCTLMLQSSTLNWKYKSTQDGGNFFEYWRMEKIGDYYYVGFDFSAEGSNPNQQVSRDFVYDDWIVKIVPGKGESIPVSRVRVMAEDLGTMSSDFDYNDVVFDILFVEENGSYKADIILQAAGGTLPLYIGEGEGNTYEVHALFGVGTDVMVNTHAEDRGLKGKSNLAPVPFTVNLPSGKNYATMKAEDAVDALNITVKIGNNTVHLTPKASYDNYSNAPKMIVAPVGTEWVDERILISKVYNKFVDWISDPTIKWWEK
jgi:hypothetical protein